MKPRGQIAPALVALVALLSAAACNGRMATDSEPARARSVIVIVVDTLRADHLGVYGYRRPTSPHIDRWSANGRVFERAYATSPWTLPSLGSILTGRLPTVHAAGVKAPAGDETTDALVANGNFMKLDPRVPTLAQLLSDAGYASAALVCNPFLEPVFALDRGFGLYDNYPADNTDLRLAAETVDRALRWIDGRSGQPFFLLVHTFEPHLDYDAPTPYRGRFADGDDAFRHPVRGLRTIRSRIAEMSAVERDFIIAAYDEEIAYVDAEIGRFLQGLEERGAFDDTLVVLTSDHGEELFEHDGFEHGHTLYDEVVRVPLILWGPGVEPGRDPTPASLIDLAPTILQAVDEPMADELPGRSLLTDVTRPDRHAPIVAEMLLYGREKKAIISWPHKAIVDVLSGTVELYDLETDPEEARDLAADRPDVVRTLVAELDDRLLR